MPTFARIEDGVVRDLVRASNNDAPDETTGAAFLADLLGGKWVQTFYPVDQPDPYPRGKYAALGDLWDGENFTAPTSPAV